MISLDNIDFYHHPPPPKPPAHTSSSSDWKSYHLPSTPQPLPFSHPLSHPLPPKPPTAVTAVIPSTIKGRFQYAVPRNIFDIELENVSTRGNSPVVGETDLEAGHQSGSQVGNGLSDRCQDASPTLVASSMTSEPPAILAGTYHCEGGENQLPPQRSALQAQLDTSPQSPGDSALCSDPIVTAAEADSGYSDERSVSAVDDLPSDLNCLQLSLSGCDAEKQTITIDGVPKHHNTQVPSPALSNPTSPENKCCARPSQHHEITFEDLPSKAAGCGEQTRALTPLHRFHQSSASCNSEEDQPASSGSHSLPTRKAAADGEEYPQKRRRRNLTSKTAQNTSLSASCHSEGSIGAFEAPSGVDFLTSHDEAQEIFGRGIIRIQPHGQRHAYFLTFLPDAVDHPPCHVQPRSTPDQSLFTKRAPHTSSKASALEKGDMQLARRQTQNQRANLKTRNNHSTRHKNSRKGLPWLPEEQGLLVKLKKDQGLHWPDVTRLFSEQYPGRSQGSIQVYWSTNLSKRLP
ncbi:hypothetical protein BJX68DRAFT_37383 [Aspergillus pseudodeflectus]|uniref:Myb-like domain-containing protein n=1 Tax=Aspergillus pseudodeflectus TaxID=176178 RepID=A0ABR4J8F0_9EURO